MKKFLSKINPYFIATFCSAISYTIAKKADIKLENPKMLVNVVFWSVDIWLFFFMLFLKPYFQKKHNINMLNIEVYKKNKKLIFAFLFIVFTSNHKAFLLGDTHFSELGTYSNFTPFVAFLIISLFKRQKIEKRYYFAFLISTVGFFIYYGFKIPDTFKALFLIYVLCNAISDILLNIISKKRNAIEGLYAENFACVVIGLFCFWYFNLFKTEYIFNKYTFATAIPTFLHHYFIITANQKSDNMIQILTLSFTKYGFYYFLDVVFFSKQIFLKEITGLMIIIFGTIYSNKNLANKKQQN